MKKTTKINWQKAARRVWRHLQDPGNIRPQGNSHSLQCGRFRKSFSKWREISKSHGPWNIAFLQKEHAARHLRRIWESCIWVRRFKDWSKLPWRSLSICRQDEDWYKMRTVVNPVLMKPGIVRRYIPQVDEISKDFINTWVFVICFVKNRQSCYYCIQDSQSSRLKQRDASRLRQLLEHVEFRSDYKSLHKS